MQVNFQICAEKGLFPAKTAVILLIAGFLHGCDVVYEEPEALPPPAPAQPLTLDCGERGYLATELFGALSGKIEWDESELICEGMARPDDHGARIRLAGMVDPDFEIAFIILPLLVPAANILGIDLVWFGVVIGMNLQTSFLTPPFGFSLFYLRGVAPKEMQTSDIYRGALPFIAIQAIGLLLVIQFPILVRYLLD